ncbi:methyltransferase domain-containing protein [Nocardia sp. NPDC019219]|uniref:methyltransferase domain-containing protein n=1 Tax=Nocardia sp. NPDC019219 TaxID=3154590 RepID=UPI0034000B09
MVQIGVAPAAGTGGGGFPGIFGGRENAGVLLSRLDRFNQRHPWSHNDHYSRWVGAQVAASGARDVLDVGCGTGNLVARLRDSATTVSALEPEPATVRVAAQRFADDPAVTIVEADFAGRDHQRR